MKFDNNIYNLIDYTKKKMKKIKYYFLIIKNNKSTCFSIK